MLRNEHSILTISSLLDGQYGIKDVCLSVPSIVGDGGVELIIDAGLTAEELAALRASAAAIRNVLDQLAGKE
jgi:L-lactate dehydrogenase